MQRHSPIIRVMHWTIAGLVLAMLGMSALVMAGIPDSSPEKLQAALNHMLAGLVLIGAFALRLHMRHRVARPPQASSGMRWADRLGTLVHRLLDLLVAVMILSGIGMALAAHLPLHILQGGAFPSQIRASWFHHIHVFGAWSIALVVSLHVAGALFHHFVLRDRLIARMLISPSELMAAYQRWRRCGMPLTPLPPERP